MNPIARSYNLVALIVEDLVAHGLAKVDYGPEDAWRVAKHLGSESWSDEDLFKDILSWMENEGIITIDNRYQPLSGGFQMRGVQLTAKGVALLQSDLPGEPGQGNVEEALSQGNLEPERYTKIGAAIGAMLGSFTRTIVGG